MKEDQVCGNCEWFVPEAGTVDPNDGRCRCDCPKVVYGREFRAMWPLVLKSDWCGNWQEKGTGGE